MRITCTICTDLYEPSDTIVSTICGHCFHSRCLSPWLKRSSTCPACRSSCTPYDTKQIFLNILPGAKDPEKLADELAEELEKLKSEALVEKQAQDEIIINLRREIEMLKKSEAQVERRTQDELIKKLRSEIETLKMSILSTDDFLNWKLR